MSTHDYRSEIEMYMDLWDDAQKDKAFQHKEPLKPNESAPSQWSSAQDMYYDYLDSEYGQEAETTDDEEHFQVGDEEFMLQEGDKFVNPVYPDTVGKDSDAPEPAWVDETLLKKIETLKNRLFEVENKVARLGQGKTWSEKPVSDNNKLMAEIESIRKQIDKVSDKLGIEDENCPWGN